MGETCTQVFDKQNVGSDQENIQKQFQKMTANQDEREKIKKIVSLYERRDFAATREISSI